MKNGGECAWLVISHSNQFAMNSGLILSLSFEVERIGFQDGGMLVWDSALIVAKWLQVHIACINYRLY